MLYFHCLLLHHRHFDDVAKVVLPWCHLKPKSASSSASSRQNFFLTSPKDAEQKKRNPGRRRRQAYGRSTRQLQLNRTTCCHLSQRVEVKQALLLPFQLLGTVEHKKDCTLMNSLPMRGCFCSQVYMSQNK